MQNGCKVTPSARADVNVKELIQKLCEEDFYKQDYADTLITSDIFVIKITKVPVLHYMTLLSKLCIP